MGADGAVNRADIHLHGGLVPWVSDGGPHAWWDPNGNKGPSFASQFLNPGAAPNEAEYYYPNNQGARLVWYHDHTFGNTRINAYAGIASGYVIYDDYELALVAANNLPGPLDPRTVYLVFQDKVFVSRLLQPPIQPGIVLCLARNKGISGTHMSMSRPDGRWQRVGRRRTLR